jgi:hypothetical protein
MQIPIYIDGAVEGKLSITRQGNMTAFEADLRDVGRVVRLRVFGDGEGYLGVPVPADGRLRLVKHLSPAAMHGFPKKPEYAAEERRTEEQQKAEPEAGQKQEEQGGPGKHVLWHGGKPHYF